MNTLGMGVVGTLFRVGTPCVEHLAKRTLICGRCTAAGRTLSREVAPKVFALSLCADERR